MAAGAAASAIAFHLWAGCPQPALPRWMQLNLPPRWPGGSLRQRGGVEEGQPALTGGWRGAQAAALAGWALSFQTPGGQLTNSP